MTLPIIAFIGSILITILLVAIGRASRCCYRCPWCGVDGDTAGLCSACRESRDRIEREITLRSGPTGRVGNKPESEVKNVFEKHRGRF